MMPGVVAELVAYLEDHRAAARPTALIASPENRNTTDAPIISPTSTFGLVDAETERWNDAERRLDARRRSSCADGRLNAPNSAVAASTAVAMAMPLVMAFVVLPTASRLGEHLRALALDVAGHLGDALRVVGDRAEGVHRRR